MITERFLMRISRILDERQRMYGPPKENLTLIAKRWSLTLGRDITPQQVALCMMDVKMTRLTHNPGHEDSLKDVIGYGACLNEINQHQEEDDETRA